ncbi:MAG TPA: YceI family protein [Bryobacteraceae bacterium]|jgi:polyisoprenoid-binding protein YceI
MKSFSLIPVALVLTLASSAGAADYHLSLEPDCTKVNWTLGDVLHTVHGTFKLRKGDIIFNNETGKAAGQVVVDTTSGESGSNARDGRMHKNVLESVRFPDAAFAPDHLEGKVDLAGTSNVKLHGTFTIHGAAHELTVPVRVTANGEKLEANIKFEVPFVAWGMKDPSTLFLKVNKAVEVEVQSQGHLVH